MRFAREFIARICTSSWSVPALVILAWTLAAFRWSLNDLVVPWDSKNQFYAFFRFLSQSLQDGAMPFWNPYHYGGHPSVADPQSLIFSPIFFLWALIDSNPTLKTFDLIVYAHLLIGGISLCLYGQRKGWSHSACMLGALIFMFGGPASSRLNHVGIIIAYGLFPFALLLLDRMIETLTWTSAALFGSCFAFIVLGRAQVPLMLICILCLYFIHEFFSVSDQKKHLRLAVMGVALLIATLICAIPLALTAQFAEISNRPISTLDQAMRSSLHPINLLNFLIPNIFGSLNEITQPDWGPGFGNSPLTDSTDRTFNYLFAGSFSAIILIIFFLAKGRHVTRQTRFFIMVAAASFIYALGRYTPIYDFFYNYIPFVSQFRRPVGASFILILMSAYLAPQALMWLIKTEKISLDPLRVTLFIGLLISLMLAGGTYAFTRGYLGSFIGELLKGILVYLLIVSFLILFLQNHRRWSVALGVASVALELITINAANVMNSEPARNYAVLESESGLAKDIMSLIRTDIDMSERGADYRPRVEIVGLGGPWQNAAMVFQLEAINGYNPLRIGEFDRLVSPGEVSYRSFSRKFTKAFPNYTCTLARKLGLAYLVTDKPIEELNRSEKVAKILAAGPKIWAYRLEQVEPRISIIQAPQLADTQTSFQNTRFDFVPGLNLQSGEQIGRGRIKSYLPGHIEVSVQIEKPGTLILHDLWYPGWKVYVDGKERPLMKSEILFRGVNVKPNDKLITFSYEPFSSGNLASAFTALFRKSARKSANY